MTVLCIPYDQLFTLIRGIALSHFGAQKRIPFSILGNDESDSRLHFLFIEQID